MIPAGQAGTPLASTSGMLKQTSGMILLVTLACLFPAQPALAKGTKAFLKKRIVRPVSRAATSLLTGSIPLGKQVRVGLFPGLSARTARPAKHYVGIAPVVHQGSTNTWGVIALSDRGSATGLLEAVSLRGASRSVGYSQGMTRSDAVIWAQAVNLEPKRNAGAARARGLVALAYGPESSGLGVIAGKGNKRATGLLNILARIWLAPYRTGRK
jgi:hypothetical protein